MQRKTLFHPSRQAPARRMKRRVARLVLILAIWALGSGMGKAQDTQSTTFQIPLSRSSHSFTLHQPGDISANPFDLQITNMIDDGQGGLITGPLSYLSLSANIQSGLGYWLSDDTTGELSLSNRVSFLRAPWRTNGAPPMQYFAISIDRVGHQFMLAQPSGAGFLVTNGDEATYISDGPNGPVDYSYGFFDAWAPYDPSQSFWLVDLTLNDRSPDNETNIADWAWQQNDRPLPVTQAVLWLDMAESRNAFTLHVRPRGGMEQLQSVSPSVEPLPAGTEYAGSSRAVIRGNVGCNTEFWLTRDWDGAESSHYWDNGEGFNGQPLAVCWLFGQFPVLPQARTPVTFRAPYAGVSTNDSPNFDYASYVVVHADGLRSELGGWSTGDIVIRYDDAGNVVEQFWVSSATALVDDSQDWYLATADGTITYPVRQTDFIPSPRYEAPPNGSIRLWIFGGRKDHVLKIKQDDGTVWPIPTHMTDTQLIPGSGRWIGGVQDYTAWGYNSNTHDSYLYSYFSVTAPYDEGTEYWVVDETAGDESPHNQPGLDTWFPPPAALLLMISASRFNDDLVLHQPNGSEFPITKGNVQGDWSTD
jgi:hypothetical protein